MVKMMTPVSGNLWLISRVAIRPPPGMLMSISTTSGRSSSTFASASSALPASPTTSIPGSVANMRARPSRSNGWSSAMSTVIDIGIQLPLPVGRRRPPIGGARVVRCALPGGVRLGHGPRHAHGDGRPFPGLAHDAELALEQARPLAHVQQAEATLAVHHLLGQPLRIKADAVVNDRQVHP